MPEWRHDVVRVGSSQRDVIRDLHFKCRAVLYYDICRGNFCRRNARDEFRVAKCRFSQSKERVCPVGVLELAVFRDAFFYVDPQRPRVT